MNEQANDTPVVAEVDVAGLREKWIDAGLSARKSEHHFAADCLAEAAHVLTTLRERVRVVEGERDAAQLALGEQADIEREAFGRGVAWAMGDDDKDAR